MPRLRPQHEQTEKPAETETVKLIRRTRQATTKRYSAEDKIRLVMGAIRGELPIIALCRREAIHANLYCRPRKRMRYAPTSAEEKAEILELLRKSPVSVRETLALLRAPRFTRPYSFARFRPFIQPNGHAISTQLYVETCVSPYPAPTGGYYARSRASQAREAHRTSHALGRPAFWLPPRTDGRNPQPQRESRYPRGGRAPRSFRVRNSRE